MIFERQSNLLFFGNARGDRRCAGLATRPNRHIAAVMHWTNAVSLWMLGSRSQANVLPLNRSDDGTFRPSAFAVLRLMTNSYLFGVCTGKSTGFSPLSMRWTLVQVAGDSQCASSGRRGHDRVLRVRARSLACSGSRTRVITAGEDHDVQKLGKTATQTQRRHAIRLGLRVQRLGKAATQAQQRHAIRLGLRRAATNSCGPRDVPQLPAAREGHAHRRERLSLLHLS